MIVQDLKALSSNREKNLVGVRSYQGKLSLRIPRQLSREFFGKDQHFAFLGLTDTAKNRKIAEKKAQWMSDDINYGCFDPTLEKYGINKPTHLTVIQSIASVPKKAELSLMEVWNQWLEYGDPIWEAKTKSQYKTFTNHLNKIPVDLLAIDKAIDVRNWILANLSEGTAKRLLIRINAAMRQALKNQLIDRNPYEGMGNEIKVQSQPEDERVDAFTARERDVIINAYENHRHYQKYAPLIKFMFWTGCRPSEAIGLTWKHVSSNFDTITFKEVIVYCQGERVKKKTTKNNKARKFPATPKIKELLQSLKGNKQPDDFVFCLSNGQPINHAHLQRSWRGGDNGVKKYHGIVTTMCEQGILSHYRNPYQTRHTFATLAVENGVFIHDVARLIGNTPKVCEERYVKSRHNLFIPEF
ncbi:MAG: site-specific integrase [Shewanella sp.]